MPPALPIYLDNHATTRTDPRVLAAMLPYFTERYGNPASKMHVFGQDAEQAVQQSRAEIAAVLDVAPRELIFTSGATESNNLALKGVAHVYAARGKHLVTVQSEHKSVLDPCARLEREGWQVTYLPVRTDGLLDLGLFAAALRTDTVLVSVMLANNEIGTLQPVAEIARLCHDRGILLHTDATQAVGKIPVNIRSLDVDLLSFSAHKLYGPKGIGALFVRRQGGRVRLQPLIDGGGHEAGLRSGTLATPLIVGFAEACRLAIAELPEEGARLRRLRDRLWLGLQSRIPNLLLNGDYEQRLPGNLNVGFPHVKGESLLLELKEIALSSGSACTSADAASSHVLRALGRDDELADASLRFGLGRFNVEEEVDYVVGRVAGAVAKLRALSSAYR